MCAVVASNTAVSDASGARKLGNVSIGMSVTGIVVTIVIVIVVVAWAVIVANRAASDIIDALDSCKYVYDGTCYTYKKHIGDYGMFGDCSGVSVGEYCYSD